MKPSNFIFLHHRFLFFFLYEINWPLLLQGIYIPLAHDTNQIPISIQKSEKEKGGQARNVGSGKLLSILNFS